MAIQTGAILDGGTTSTTGGTSKSLTPDGQRVNNGIHVSDASVTDARVRPGISFSSRPAVYDKAKNKWPVKQRAEAKLDFPKVLGDLSIDFPGVRIIVTAHPEQSDAEITKMINWSAQLLSDSDYTSFFKTGNLA